jgi:hypothetical protein
MCVYVPIDVLMVATVFVLDDIDDAVDHALGCWRRGRRLVRRGI